MIKPILKWAGGKTQIINTLISKFPNTFNNYHEVFLGGGSVLLALLTFIKNGLIKINGNIYAYDLNETLINVYINIQSNHIELYNELQIIINEFNNIENKEDYYYLIRDKYNNLSSIEKNSIIGSSLFIFLNKTCFRGLYREGPNGFNVPFGHYKNPEIINLKHLEEVHLLIKNVIFKCCDFTNALNDINIKDDDFIYLDPPYAPLNTKSFVKYTNNGFNKEQHLLLFNICNNLKNKFIMSNADVDLVKSYFKEDIYNIDRILCKRSINSKNPDSRINELIIKNY